MDIFSLPGWFISRSRRIKRAVTLLFDFIVITLALWVSFSLRLGEFYWPEGSVIWLFAVAPFIATPIFIRLGLYRAIIRYIGFHSLWVVVKAVSLYSLLIAFFVVLANIEVVPRSVHIINWLVALLMVGGSRMVVRWWLAGLAPANVNAARNVVIYGAGSSGMQVLGQLNVKSGMKVVAFIDDEPSLHRRQMGDVRVHPFSHLSRLIERHGVKDVLLAMPSVSRSRRNQVIALLEPYPVTVKTLPTLAEIAEGEVTVDDIRDVEIEDLLGRDQVLPNKSLMAKNIHNKVVMVTGAGGSIGAELCRQILQQKPKEIVLFEHSEFALYMIEHDLKNQPISEEVVIKPVLGSVTDSDRVLLACQAAHVETVYHAAAYKHVPLVEQNPREAIKNNILGTLYTAEAALKSKVKDFILISTDKAVRPTNTMGASKRMAELVLQALSNKHRGVSATQFAMVRFGNVLGSSGSVIPLFKKQIKEGGPVTVTDPKIIRYFMTIPEAAQLVIQAGAMAKGGDVFVLDMGDPVKILELAKRMIHLSGLEVKGDDTPHGDIEIKFTGLRPGEKLYEELLIGNDVKNTDHEKIMRANESMIPWEELNVLIRRLQQAINDNDDVEIRAVLSEAVVGYKPQCAIANVLH
ncbi:MULTISPECIES: nucleoside-diphosphate sugar epimerase/dehydratase [Cycloclasticus]|uniref:Nucleotide sugar epimerase/dehydratase WbpM n=1 Tax=Cycloclasticus pugetii TaxID=34068 RepID=A0AB33Z1G6_9GAMM|nr:MULTISPECIES: nucleoside-diphosphate sugar epimerase/dehydratase [Cycloclasticus]AFT68004.1 Nucleotide sugar epimerase/dehydratase WbpM [Cycloclasticus sp. P1]ATI02459.1 polysaccharide biosynthesis protein [Cycloclasticus sp. PY97N]EPD12923.1 nucleotide sugar epimerase/dehydratase WbpM [Cycloclasticus pugetii]